MNHNAKFLGVCCTKEEVRRVIPYKSIGRNMVEKPINFYINTIDVCEALHNKEIHGMVVAIRSRNGNFYSKHEH